MRDFLNEKLRNQQKKKKENIVINRLREEWENFKSKVFNIKVLCVPLPCFFFIFLDYNKKEVF